ncbi:cysteine-rich secretory protein LCCL domain-containing 1 isoform X3 [Paralichthys olivaceus]|uniref:cysteine-rich secretory protein LCCL domain-containing 1 isoform X3 n=1 Tax=Paralichthys olivaceus TaxID=8255 RepID=UPI0037529A3A
MCRESLHWLRGASLLLLLQAATSMVMLPNSTGWQQILDKYLDEDGDWWEAKQRGKRAITDSDAQLILDLHNKLRGQVYPPSSNMEYMVWDTELERTAEEWAETCLWEHGPAGLLPQIGQNLGAHWGRYRPPTFHVQAWYDEVKDYSFPYPQECNPHCPFRCSGPVCTHYTQLVWATSSRIGCAVNMCYNMNVWGQIWAKAVYLVCNYSPKGNWWGYSPYKHGTPCSACPPSYGGSCKDNLCYKGQLVTCDTKLRDQCKGTACNRYECPAGCLDATGKVVGTVYYEMQSSVCRAGLHAGVIDNDGGWMDVTRQGRKDFFIKSNKNGVQSTGKYQSANSFTVFRVSVKAITCETTVAQLCPYQKPAKHCPRLYCPRSCSEENPHISRVIGTRIYSDKSSICRAAVHAGVIRNEAGGYIDVMPVDKRRHYIASHQNGISSESLQNPPGGKAFRVFAVI